MKYRIGRYTYLTTQGFWLDMYSRVQRDKEALVETLDTYYEKRVLPLEIENARLKARLGRMKAEVRYVPVESICLHESHYQKAEAL